MRVAPEAAAPALDGVPAATLAARLGLARVVVLGETTSTMDVAHAMGEAGTPSGTLVVADRQTAGRGRQGRRWESPPGAGLWLTLLERELDASLVSLLSIRLGIAAAPVLDRFARAPVQLKWPNDLYCDGRKLAGILAEARWREGRADYVAIGVGLNVAPPPALTLAAGLRPGARRVEVLEALVPALRAAVARRGPLQPLELRAFAARDLAAGELLAEPVRGRAAGVAPDGALLVEQDGQQIAVHSGSLRFAREGA